MNVRLATRSLSESVDKRVYFENLKSSVEKREVNFGRAERNKMFLSHKTYEGILISVYSVIESVKFLIQDGMKFVLTERFNQDVAEGNFGSHRGVGRRDENPSLHQFGYDRSTDERQHQR